ncbi:hypothetical protein [Deinococcus cavernae]|uniref:hypothetical protein n=1 Tax=Deinococcus cavernae TaxID=2320857 RepID=UPI0011C21E94|nr:hypothetical protein [Deinococcus cavernae]
MTNATLNVAKANPVTVVYTLDYPAQFDKITMLFVDSGILKEVPIKGGPSRARGPPSPRHLNPPRLPRSRLRRRSHPRPSTSMPSTFP